MVRAGSQTGHGRDTILIGETAPRGGKKPTQLGNAMAPAEFVRELYCLKRNFRPYSGRAARLRSCPATARGARPVPQRHILACSPPAATRFTPTASTAARWRLPTWRHPHPRQRADRQPPPHDPHARPRQRSSGAVPGSPCRIWITEYGYQTSPPDPFAGVQLSRQGPLTAWGEYLAYRNPRVASIAQFLLVDDKPHRRPGEQPQGLDHLAVRPVHARRPARSRSLADYQVADPRAPQRGGRCACSARTAPAPNGVTHRRPGAVRPRGRRSSRA